MELDEIIEAKASETRSLKMRLEGARNSLDKVKEKFPPLWSGGIKDLDKFADDLERWIRNPQVKRAWDLIDNLKQNAKDTRSFAGLSEDYLISILVPLEKAATLVPGVTNEQLKLNMAKNILDVMGEEKDIAIILDNLSGYWLQFNKFEASKVENEFLKAAKDDLTASLVKDDAFATAQVTSAEKTLDRARGALQLLSGTPVNTQAYAQTYKKQGSIDKVWECADKVRNLLRRTFQFPTEPSEPFKEISTILSHRERCMTQNSLEEIYYGLTENSKQTDEWAKRAKPVFEEEFRTIKTLVEFSGLDSKVDGIVADFSKNIDLLNLKACDEDYKNLQEVKGKATAALEKKISKEERGIIEHIEKANELAEEMGGPFWEGVKSLKDKRLIKIKLERNT